MGETIATNKKAFRDYFFTDRWEAGMALSGGEVKSIRAGHVNFKDTFCRPDKDEIFIYNLHILPYEQASYLVTEPDRKRKLLLHKKEIKKLVGKMTQSGMSLIPTKLYFNNRGFVKVEIALAKGKKLYDQREDIKKRDANRELQRAIRQKQR